MEKEIEILKKHIDDAEVIVIGAGAGLSSAAGFEYGGSTFLKYFKYMHDMYGYTDMYSAGFHNFKSPEEKWAYWSKMIYVNRYKVGPTKLYKHLLNIIKNKNYFVITTNVNHQFQLSGFDKERLFYTQGDYGLFQCSKACHNKTYDNKEIVEEMIKQTNNNLIPTKLVPKCPVCGSLMDTNLRKDNYFVEDEDWHKALDRYEKFLKENKEKKILFLEIGVGWNTPGIIKFPFLQMTYRFKNAFYISINNDPSDIPNEIKDKAIHIKEDLNILLKL